MQVINQYQEDQGNHDTRYDVTILVNGLPLVHVELKRRGVAIREAFNQIKRYQRDSFWVACGLYEYVQIFVISNGTHTKYYSNTTRISHVQEMAGSERRKSKKPVTVLNLPRFGQMVITKQLLILWILQKRFCKTYTFEYFDQVLCVYYRIIIAGYASLSNCSYRKNFVAYCSVQ